MKKLIICFTLLIPGIVSAQISTVANANVENPPYGMIAQLWNSTASPIYLDSIEANGSPVGTFTGTIIIAIGLSNQEEQNCQANDAYQLGSASLVPVTTVRVSQQPCTPHGLPYGVPYAGGCGGLNYTCTNFMSLKTCYAWMCSENFSTALMIPPGTGITIYTARYTDPDAFGWMGYSSVHFRWHDHTGCPAAPINNMMCLQ